MLDRVLISLGVFFSIRTELNEGLKMANVSTEKSLKKVC